MTEIVGAAALDDRAIGQAELRRGWKPLAACAVGIGLGTSGLQTYTGGIFAVALEGEFGWSRSEILGAVLLQTAAAVFIGPFLGKLTDRIGARPIAICSTIGLGVTTAAFSLITSQIWTYYLAYGLMVLAALGTLPPIYAKVVSLWFDRKRGFALGLALSTTGVSGMILPIYVQALIGSVGWRWAYVGLGLMPILIALPCILLWLPRGASPIERDLTERSKATGAIADEGLSIGEAMRSYKYWLMAAFAVATGTALGGLVFNLVPMLVDRGIKPAAAAGLFGLFGMVVVLGRLITGWLLDRIWAPAVGFFFLVGACVGALLLQSGTSSPTIIAIAVILFALSSGSEFDLMAYITSRYFGRRNFSALYSGQYAFFVIGAGASPALFASFYDIYGSYRSALMLTSLLFALSAVIIVLLGRYPNFDSGVVKSGKRRPAEAG